MPDNTQPAAGQPADPNKKPDHKHGDVEQGLLDDIQLAKDVLAAAGNPDHAAIYVKEVKQADVDALAAQVKIADEKLVPDVIEKKHACLVPTQLEQSLNGQLVAKLRWIQGQAERTYLNDHAKRAAYLVGKKDFGSNRETLGAEARAILDLAKKDQLKGVDVAVDLPAIETLLGQWSDADKEQKRCQTAYGSAIRTLRGAVANINTGRRDLQKGADNTFAYTDKANAPQRRAFKLQADRPMKM